VVVVVVVEVMVIVSVVTVAEEGDFATRSERKGLVVSGERDQ
jgi:hypothetical protein